MTKSHFAALLAATSLGFAGGTLTKKASSESKNSTFVHALTVTGPGDGGADRITAYQTESRSDGGLEDLGPSQCVGKSAVARTYAEKCKLPDAGSTGFIHVLEIRPGNDAGLIAIESYGSKGTARCALPKTAKFSEFVDSLECVSNKPSSTASPL